MREILFRAKEMFNGRWLTGYYIKKHGNYYISEDDTAAHWIDINTLCEYTGKKDSNGARIFENDLVKVKYHDGETGEPIYHVIYDGEHCSWMMLEFGQTDPDPFEDIWNLEVECGIIGNIFDNPGEWR